jgi:hypothetical protein
MRTYLQPVLCKWRELLFPSGFELGPIAQESAQGADPLYDAMIKALEDQLSVLLTCCDQEVSLGTSDLL